MLLLTTGRGWPLVITTALGLCFVLFTMLRVWAPAATGGAGVKPPCRNLFPLGIHASLSGVQASACSPRAR